MEVDSQGDELYIIANILIRKYHYATLENNHRLCIQRFGLFSELNLCHNICFIYRKIKNTV